MNWLHYLVEANIYLSVFYLFYCLFLNKETHYLLNRLYLLGSCLAAFIIPLLQIGVLKPADIVSAQASVVSGGAAMLHAPVIIAAPTETVNFTLQDFVMYAYVLGASIVLISLVIKLYQLFKLSNSKSESVDGDYKLIYIEGSNTAFSFLNYLFIGTQTSKSEIIIRHELVHIRQKHSADIILLEIIKIVSWFNPLIYLLENSLKTIHEYIADEQSLSAQTDAFAYSSFLVDNAYGISGSSITHSFFNYNLLKKRIIMLNQQRSGNLARLKYLVALPICAGLLCASTLGFSKTYGWVDLAPKKVIIPTITKKQKIKTLRLTQGQEIGYGDKITIYKKDYTVNSLTETDEMFLLKNYGIKLEVVEIEGKHGQVTLFFQPAPKIQQIKFPPPIIKPDVMVVPQDSAASSLIDTTNSKAFQSFYAYLGKSIRYPAVDHDNKVTGKVFATFSVDADHKIKDVAIVRGPSEALDKETLRAIEAYPGRIPAKADAIYTIPVNFSLSGYDGPETIDHNFKNMGTMPVQKGLNYELDEVIIVGYLPKN